MEPVGVIETTGAVPFKSWGKIHRFYRDWEVTEKLDGTNGVVYVGPGGTVLAGSRNRWLTTQRDNHGFAAWVESNAGALLDLGEGYHWGEWWGRGIQRGYGLAERHFSLFDAGEVIPPCCRAVPILFRGALVGETLREVCVRLRSEGSAAAPGWLSPEGVVVRHLPSGHRYKYTFDGDGVRPIGG